MVTGLRSWQQTWPALITDNMEAVGYLDSQQGVLGGLWTIRVFICRRNMWAYTGWAMFQGRHHLGIWPNWSRPVGSGIHRSSKTILTCVHVISDRVLFTCLFIMSKRDRRIQLIDFLKDFQHWNTWNLTGYMGFLLQKVSASAKKLAKGNIYRIKTTTKTKISI